MCPNSTLDAPEDYNKLQAWIHSALIFLAEFDYPYPSNFIAPLPAWPAEEVCKFLTNPDGNDQELATDMQKALNLFWNYTGEVGCVDLRQKTPTGIVGYPGYLFQLCSGLSSPGCSNGTDMFPVQKFDPAYFSDFCYGLYGVRPDPRHATIEFGSDKIAFASNIIFSNGNLDPASAGAIDRRPPGADDSIIVLNIDKAAHHLDLRAANDADPDSLKEVRKQETEIIKCWVENPLKRCSLN